MSSASRARAALLLLVCVGLIPAGGQTPPAAASARLRLKTGNHYASPAIPTCSIARSVSSSPPAHFIAIFQSVPNATDARNLRRLGYDVIAFVPDNGLLVYGNPSADLSAAGVIENYSLQAADKLSARLDPATPGELTAVVQMQPDGNAGIMLSRMLLAGATLLPNQDLSTTEYLAQAPYVALREIAGWDETAYIYPASPQMTSGQRVVPCSMGYSGGAVLGVAANLVPTFGDGWAGASHGSAVVTYMLHTAALPLAESDVRAALQSVLAEWSAYAAIRFAPTTLANASGSIDISFPSGDHGDGFPFTPFGAVLAHTFYPPPNPEPIAGDMHMNYDEAWSVDGSLQLYVVMLHEMGHALGLGHSDNPADVMYPYYQGTQHLAAGDVEALRTLYAAPTAAAPAIPATPIDPVLPVAPATPTTPSAPSTPTTTPAAPSGGDKIPPLVQIYSPSMAAILTYQESLTVQGFATDNVGVTQILWSNSAGGSGSATVANPFVIPGIALVPGVNRILIQAYDAAGNIGAAHLNVTKK
ncbi:MAG: matrixin family metalloprotease [Bryobacteraceae bacterium]|nr:matrixin family metalloprotease [Bryobacteraceae bacterium]